MNLYLTDLLLHRQPWDGHRKPVRAVGGVNAVSVAPVVFRILDLVIEKIEIGVMNQVKVALPWEIVRLENDDVHA